MEALFLEFKEMKENIDKNKEEIKILKDVNSKHCDNITQIKEENSQIKEENAQIKEENAQIKDENSQMKKENAILQERVEALLRNEKRSEEDTLTMSLVSSDESVTVLTHKVGKLSSKVSRMEKTIKEVKEEFTTGMATIRKASTKMEERSATLNGLQRVFNSLHFSLQSRKELEDEVKKLKSEITAVVKMLTPRATPDLNSMLQVPVPLMASGGIHPSKRAHMSVADAAKQCEIQPKLIERSTFHVLLDEIKTEKGVNVWIGGYTVKRPCDFMDPVSGVYSVPVKGAYKFHVHRKDIFDDVFINLCRDRDDKQERISYKGSDYFQTRSLLWQCNVNDKIWLETSGSRKKNLIQQLEFSGNLDEMKM